MTEPGPKCLINEYVKKVGEIPVAIKEWRERGDAPYTLFGLDESAPDDLKLEFEKYEGEMFCSLARFYVPDMEEPYYTWEGKVVEKASLKDRELPLVNPFE